MSFWPLATLFWLALPVALTPAARAQTSPTANPDGSYTVPYAWGLKPAGLDEDDRFRLLFVTSSRYHALASDIDFYNNSVRDAANRGHSLIRPYGSQFHAVASTSSTDARDNTSTTGTGVPIYWLNGLKVADDYADFYDGSWDNVDTFVARKENGSTLVISQSTYARVWTGSDSDGTASSNPLGIGSDLPVTHVNLVLFNRNVYVPDSQLVTPLATSNNLHPSFISRLYALSPVFVVDADPQDPELTITGGSEINEGQSASFTITADRAPETDLTVSLSVADAPSPSDFLTEANEGAQTVVLPAGDTSVVFKVLTVEKSAFFGDEPDGDITVTLEDDTGYAVGNPSSGTVKVKDTGLTTANIEVVPVNLPESSSLTFSIRLNRELVTGEVLPFPLIFGGTADRSEYTVSCESPLPTGVTCADLATTTPTVTFTGPSARIVDLTVRAAEDFDVEEPKSVTIGHTVGHGVQTNYGTGLSGGVIATDNMGDFYVLDSINVQLGFAVDATGVREGVTPDPVNNIDKARFSAHVLGGTVPVGGALIPVTVNTGTSQANDASSADYGTVPEGIFIAEGELQGTAMLSIVDDNEDELRERIHWYVDEETFPPGYVLAASGLELGSLESFIIDNDRTPVSLSLAGGGTITEQDTSSSATVTIRTDRPLVSDPLNPLGSEELVVPLELASTTGAALPGSINPMFAVTVSGTGVSISDVNSATPKIKFIGHATDVVQEATVTFTPTANGDSDSTAETVTVTMGTMTILRIDGGAIATADNSTTLTIADDDSPPVLSVEPMGMATVTEGGSKTIRVTRNGGADLSTALSFNATTTDATGFNGAFTNVNTIPANQRFVDITYSVAQDTSDAPQGEAIYTLQSGTGYTISPTAGAVSLAVMDDDATKVTLAGAGDDLEEGDTKAVTVTLGRGLVAGEVLVVPLTFGTEAGAATRGADYTLSGASGTGLSYQNLDSGDASVTFTGPNTGITATVATLTLTAEPDDVVEANGETVDMGLGTLDASSGTGLDGGASGADNLASFTIEDLPANAVNISIRDSTITEGDEPTMITATLDRPQSSGSPISIPLQIRSSGTSAESTDFMAPSSISIPNDQKSGTAPLMATDDHIDEEDETVIIDIGSSLPMSIIPGLEQDVGFLLIDNDSTGLVISPISLALSEGGNGSYTVKLGSEPTGTVTVAITGQAGTDLSLDKTSLTFTTGTWNDAQTITVTAGEDADAVNDTATLAHTASGGGYSLSANLAITITDDDTGTEVGVTGGGAITEGAAASFTLTATPAPATGDSIDVAVTISDSGSFASTGQTGSRTITINDNGTAGLTVGTEDDNIHEEDGSITVVVQGGTGYDPHSTSASASVTVEDDDDLAVMVSPGSLTITEGSSASYTVALNVEPTDAMTVTVTDMAGTGLTLDKTSLTFTPSTWNTPQSMSITAARNSATDDPVSLVHRATGGGDTGVAPAIVMVTVVAADPWVLNGWHLRFGRTVSQQVLDAVQGRFTTRPAGGMTLTVAGEAITGGLPLEEHEGVLAKALGFETVSTEALVQDSSFTFTPAAEAAAPQPAFWGQGALSSFAGRQDALSLDGRVITALLGADWSTERWRAGVALSHSRGSGTHEAEEGANHDVSSSMTGLFPYGRYGLTPRLGFWAVAGYGWGRLLLKPHGNGAEAVEAPSNLRMGAVGMDGLLLDGGDESITLSTTADLLLVGATSAAVDGLAASEGSLSRLRLGLEAVRPFLLSDGAVLTPSMELGVRYDQGDAETGYGVDLGGGVLWRDPERGISSAVQGRTLLVHGEKEFQDQGLSLSFAWDASPSNRGPSLSLSHAVGASTSEGMAALLDPVAIETLDGPGSNGWQQFEAEVAYGFPVDNDRLTLAPAVALTLSPDSRSYGLLWSLAPYSEKGQGEQPWGITLEGEREEQVSSASPPEHSLKLLFSLLF